MSATDATREPLAPAVERPPGWVATFDRRAGRGDGARGPLELAIHGEAGVRAATDGPYRVVFDGWLHNRDELAALGGAPGASDDAQVLLNAYRGLGAGAVPRIKGMFVALIWDGAREELLCVRDPLGRLPLFYAPRGDELVFSTALEEVVRAPGVPRDLNRVVLAEHLCCRWTDPEDTHYAAVRRVPAGNVLVLGAGGRRLYRYWDPVPTLDSGDWVGDDDIDRFEELFDQAVGRGLDIGAAGIFLSGGLDSVSVAALATDLSRARGMPSPWALSLGFPHPDTDEVAVQEGVAGQLGIRQVLLWFDEALGGLGRVESTIEGSSSMPMPLIGLWPPAYWRLATEGRSRGCEVILTGGGGDEMLLPSQYVAADLIRHLRLRQLGRFFQELKRSYPWSTPRMVYSTFWEFGARPLLQRSFRKVLGAVSPGTLEGRWRRQIAEGTPPWVRLDPSLQREVEARALRDVADWPPLDRDFYYHECRTALDQVTVSLEMERSFEEGRRAGLTIVEPFWDPDLQEFLYRVPPHMLNQGGRTKGLVRDMLARRFPELGFERQKKVIGREFANDTFVSEVPKALREMGGAPALAELGVVDQRQLDHAIARLATDPRERYGSHRLWHVLSLEAWVRAHG